ncbi:T3SS effector HopA1 family protein, partial [Providencia alcalifaciens]
MEIKTEYKNNGSWSSSSVKKLKIIESNLSNFIYKKYSSNKPIDASSLTSEEQKEYLDKFKLLAENNPNIEIRIQGKNEDYFSHLSDSDLLDGDAYRLLPKDFNGRYKNNSMLMSRLTINVKKEHYFSLAEALVYLYERDPHNKIMQSKIMGPKKLGNLTDQAVIYFPNANLQDAIEIANELKELLPEDAFVEHVPIGMHRIDKGISYSETLKNQSSSHGEVRAEIMAKAVSESLLTGTPVEECLDHQLSIYGYSVENPALISQSVREASHDISLAGSNHGVEVLPSKDINIFKQDPINFSQQYILNAKELNTILQLPSEGKVIFNKKIGHGYFIEYVDDSYRNDDFNSIDCYFLESKMRSKDSKQVEYVDIPKKNSEIQFLFTGQLRGGSIIVTELNSETYRVY